MLSTRVTVLCWLFLSLAGLTAMPGSMVQASYPGSNGLIAFDRILGPHPQLFTIGADGSSSTQRTHDSGATAGLDDSNPVWSPDGSKIAFLGSGHILVLDVSSNAVTDITPNDSADITNQDLNWTPDGSRLVFARIDYSKTTPQYDIYELSGTHTVPAERTLSDVSKSAGVDETQPSMSPDGKRIAYVRDGKLWTMTSAGTDQSLQVDASPATVSYPDWSPDGGRIAFIEDQGGSDTDVWTWDGVHGDSANQLTGTANREEEAPRWSPDGTGLVVQGLTRPDDSPVSLYTVDSTTGDETLIPNTRDAALPSWGAAAPPVQLTVTVEGAGSVTSQPVGISCPSTCKAGFVAGTRVSLTPTPSAGQLFAGWDICPHWNDDNTCVVGLSNAASVTARFEPASDYGDHNLFGTVTTQAAFAPGAKPAKQLPVANQTVELRDAGGNVLVQTQTDQHGVYHFAASSAQLISCHFSSVCESLDLVEQGSVVASTGVPAAAGRTGVYEINLDATSRGFAVEGTIKRPLDTHRRVPMTVEVTASTNGSTPSPICSESGAIYGAYRLVCPAPGNGAKLNLIFTERGKTVATKPLMPGPTSWIGRTSHADLQAVDTPAGYANLYGRVTSQAQFGPGTKPPAIKPVYPAEVRALNSHDSLLGSAFTRPDGYYHLATSTPGTVASVVVSTAGKVEAGARVLPATQPQRVNVDAGSASTNSQAKPWFIVEGKIEPPLRPARPSRPTIEVGSNASPVFVCTDRGSNYGSYRLICPHFASPVTVNVSEGGLIVASAIVHPAARSFHILNVQGVNAPIRAHNWFGQVLRQDSFGPGRSAPKTFLPNATVTALDPGGNVLSQSKTDKAGDYQVGWGAAAPAVRRAPGGGCPGCISLKVTAGSVTVTTPLSSQADQAAHVGRRSFDVTQEGWVIVGTVYAPPDAMSNPWLQVRAVTTSGGQSICSVTGHTYGDYRLACKGTQTKVTLELLESGVVVDSKPVSVAEARASSGNLRAPR